MRLLLPILLLLAGCGDRRSFDERFNDTEARLKEKSAELERKQEEADREASGNLNDDASIR